MIVAFHILRIYIFYISYISFFPSLPQFCLCVMNHSGSFARPQGVTSHLSVKLRDYQATPQHFHLALIQNLSTLFLKSPWLSFYKRSGIP